MTSIIKLHAISGAMDESPPCYILQVDDFRILLDCGWDENFDQEFMKELRRFIHQIDAVLLSYPDPLHLGALPYLVGKCGLNCPIYATIPVYKMGQMFMYDLYQSRHNMEDFDLFTLDDVDAAFDKIVQLKYNQSVPMKGKGYGLTITPLPAGHMIGGTIWKIVKVGEEDIVYAVDFNHKKERHLNGCELERLQRPSLLITDAFNATYQQARRRTRDEKLMTNILQTLRNNGNVLVTVDTAGRVLELAHMLDQLWRNKDSGLLAYSLALLNNVSYNVVEFAKSQIEWMSDKLMRTFEGARNNPFQFKHLQLCHSMAELSRVPSPKVVLASTPDMECGFSRELFLQWSLNSHNSIIITNRTSPGTLARELIENGGKLALNLEIRRRVRLEGAELEEYQRKERENKEKNQDKNEDVDMSDESEDEMDSLSAVAKGKHDLLVKTETKVQTGFFKSNKKQYPMFPFFEEKVKFDEYGEIIRPEDYKMVDSNPETEDNKENVDLKEEEVTTIDIMEVPTKCISVMKTVRVMAQVQYIDFEGRSDGESLQKILGQLRPRRLILVRGTPESTHAMLNLCRQWSGARVFAPSRGEIVDATTETHIYQVRLTDALVSALELKKGKEAELAWLDAQIMVRDMSKDAKPVIMGVDDDGKDEEDKMEIDKIYTLEPLPLNQVAGHQTAFINELKLSDFKQVLNKNNIPSEFSGGVLWCCNGTVAVRRHEAGRVILEGCLSDDYYRVRELLYEQYAIV
ncbi:probable cleavage and polyadenylation specificity factor subunit 2 isoform X2 [Zootermopsis nevadensis]|uniref:Cleavage and polyadenylation specificity factor subunit 2 n=2 Tax=Zootermopsis nevadensis TaxID=136037 RepID=A0A067RD17_ZOONE|nr:probable cleavage and polyadenylation specificity factor subunit 2 isoform X2 [Zootermopsis nevadensis]XP_021915179.1 probable cleavage and polyadenylation specificity factor subunit 2 isoform X2 [Zootermopsis nevadensis]KDR21766.1 putative cleavage and polyadenylation specificity factor subunit 2 [Zootermopsis nevadensis]